MNIFRPSIIFFLFLSCTAISGKMDDSLTTTIASKEKNNRLPASAIKKGINLCNFVKNKKGIDFKSTTRYVSSIIKKASLGKSVYKKSSALFFKNYLSENFEEIGFGLNNGKFKFEELKSGTIIVLNNSCLKGGTAAIYCKGKYYATKFVDPLKLEKKVNSANHPCRLGTGLQIITQKSKIKEL